jgi:hypothetical protein
MRNIPCTVAGCPRRFKSQGGRTYHVRTHHENHNIISTPSIPTSASNEQHEPEHLCLNDSPRSPSPPPSPQPRSPRHTPPQPSNGQKIFHPHLTGPYVLLGQPHINLIRCKGTPCDENGNPLEPGTPPPPRSNAANDDWSPYADEVQFRLADFAFRSAELSGPNCNELLDIWALDKMKNDELAPFASYEHMYAVIDSTKHGDVPWQSFKISWAGEITPDSPMWQREEYEICYRDPDAIIRDMLDNPDFNGQFDYAPYVELDKSGKRRWNNFMSGNFSWRHCVGFFPLHLPFSILIID